MRAVSRVRECLPVGLPRNSLMDTTSPHPVQLVKPAWGSVRWNLSSGHVLSQRHRASITHVLWRGLCTRRRAFAFSITSRVCANFMLALNTLSSDHTVWFLVRLSRAGRLFNHTTSFGNTACRLIRAPMSPGRNETGACWGRARAAKYESKVHCTHSFGCGGRFVLDQHGQRRVLAQTIDGPDMRQSERQPGDRLDDREHTHTAERSGERRRCMWDNGENQ